MTKRIEISEDGKLTGGERVEVTFLVTTTWAYDLTEEGEVCYPEIHDEHDAVAEIRTLFRDYLENEESPFYTDYGPLAWGGYTGPFVLTVQVQRA